VFLTLTVLVVSLPLVIPAHAATWTVCSGGCDFTSIQAAVDAAEGGDTIELGAETFFETVVLTKSLTFRGAGTAATIVDGTGASAGAAAVFEGVFVGSTPVPFLTIEDMTIRGGPAGVVYEVVEDDALLPVPEVRLTRTLITGNDGPGIAGPGFVLAWSTVSDNGGDGVRGGRVDVEYSTIDGNAGVGINARGGINHITASAITRNGGVGVKIEGYSHCWITNSTISGNAGHGVEDRSYGCLAIPWFVITSTTITANGVGGVRTGWFGSCVLEEPDPGILALRGSIVADNAGPQCIGREVASSGHNLAGDDSCRLRHATDLLGTDPLLLSLEDNGGPTPTHALHPDSPAIDAVDGECEPTDQRGVLRPQDGDGDGVATCDIGAFEFVPPTPLELLNELIGQVQSLGLHHGIENSLLAKLGAAVLILGDLQPDNDHAAANVLGAFIRHVQAQNGKKISSADADALIDAADQIIELLGGSVRIRREEFRNRLFSPGKRRGFHPHEPE
jgi:hypothetical protein